MYGKHIICILKERERDRDREIVGEGRVVVLCRAASPPHTFIMIIIYQDGRPENTEADKSNPVKHFTASYEVVIRI